MAEPSVPVVQQKGRGIFLSGGKKTTMLFWVSLVMPRAVISGLHTEDWHWNTTLMSCPCTSLRQPLSFFSEINKAYDTLSDSQKRKAYDDLYVIPNFETARAAACPSSSSFGHWRGKNWETDQCWCWWGIVTMLLFLIPVPVFLLSIRDE